jgi:ATP-dependent RNA helicase DDX1
MPAFEELGLAEEILQCITRAGWLLPTDVQDEAIPLILGGGDVMVAAETGSGKTGAFALPILQVVHEVLLEQTHLIERVAKQPQKRVRLDISSIVKMNSSDKEQALQVGGNGFLCEVRQQFWAGARASVGVSNGCYHFTAQVLQAGIPRVGWASASASFELGTCNSSWGYGGTGKKSHGREFTDYGGGGYSKGDTIGSILQMPHCGKPGSISFTKNGTWLGRAFVVPAKFSQPLFPAVCLKGTSVKLDFRSTIPNGSGKGAGSGRPAKKIRRVCADCGNGGSLHIDAADLEMYCAACFKRLYGLQWQDHVQDFGAQPASTALGE